MAKAKATRTPFMDGIPEDVALFATLGVIVVRTGDEDADSYGAEVQIFLGVDGDQDLVDLVGDAHAKGDLSAATQAFGQAICRALGGGNFPAIRVTSARWGRA